mmetsp:Transcript_34682/g.60989  ORF Transcript_34682/g.60989 Transcript_34682/m.60989 type:complete len:105 (-) Transcript_34682:1559-1873(-)
MQHCSLSNCIATDNKVLKFLLWYFFALCLAGTVLLIYIGILCAADAEVLNIEGRDSHTIAAFVGAALYGLGLGLTSYIIYQRHKQTHAAYEGYVQVEQEMAERL